MANKKWFKAEEHGWGWYPARWQGWMLLVVYVLLIAKNILIISATSSSLANAILRYIFAIIVLTFVLIVVCYLTGEKPHWNWGKKKKENL